MAWPLLLFAALLAPAGRAAEPPDTTGRADTLAAAGPEDQAPELPGDDPGQPAVRYRADIIDYLVDRQQIRLEGGVRVGYKDITITADSIDFFTRDQLMVVRARPVLYDRDDAIRGDRMVYDFRARRGWIYNGSTAAANGRYWGSRIRQAGDRTLNVDYGRFTTCDSDTPHFYFWSRRMKIYLGDKMVAEPVALCFAGVPVLVIPYYFFPLRRDRHSGFLMPRVGSNNYQGMFVKNLAYYQVLGDQADVTVAADLYEYVGWQGAVEGRWWRQPRFALNARYSYLEEQDPFKRRWSFSFDHNQALGPRTRLSGSGNFISDRTYYYEYSENRAERMEQELRSYLSLNHSWTSASAGAVADYSRNLASRSETARLPEASLDLYGKDLLGRRLQVSGRSYLAALTSKDTVRTDRHQVWDNQVNLSSGLTVLRYLSLRPNARLVATWHDRDTAGARNPVRYFWAAGASASTTLYGLLPLRAGPLVALRHQLQPSLSYSYAPRIDQGRFYAVGSGSYGEYRNLGASLGNTFSLKYRRGEQTRKADLLTWNASSGLNLLQRPRRWSPLTSGFNILPGNPYVSCYLNSSYDWYRRMTQHTTLSLGLSRSGTWLAPPRADSLPAGPRAAPEQTDRPDPDGGRAEEAAPDDAAQVVDSAGSAPSGEGRTEAARPAPAAGGLPWLLSLSFDQSWQSGRGVAGSGLRGSVNLDLTRNWRASYSQYYDLKRGETVSRDYSVHRDLHCWEASFTSTKSGAYWSYEFRVNLKKIPEIKLNIPKTGQVRYE